MTVFVAAIAVAYAAVGALYVIDGLVLSRAWTWCLGLVSVGVVVDPIDTRERERILHAVHPVWGVVFPRVAWPLAVIGGGTVAAAWAFWLGYAAGAAAVVVVSVFELALAATFYRRRSVRTAWTHAAVHGPVLVVAALSLFLRR